MDISESAENQRIYQQSTHAEFRGVFHGPINVGSGGPRRRSEILEWISMVPYINHHRRISDDRLAGTGEWILTKEKYRTWIESSDSMLLLLRGIPGAGKTYIASQVIDRFLSNPTAESKLAYFYCNRAEESRRDPESILRTLIQQLAQTPAEDKLLKPVLDVYNEREKKGQLSSRLTLKECQNLLVQLIAVYPQTTICIDALDEVDHRLRLKLLEAFKHVVARSNTQVKIFATTRMDTDILMQFEMFPRIELEPDDNVDDINRFVEEKIQGMIERKVLLHGNVPNTLKDEICQVLRERSKGMFQLAALQITLLCDMITLDDVRDSLTALPETLTDAYGEIYNRIRNQSHRASRLALNAFRWVLCSYEPLQSETLLDAITVEVGGSGEFSRQVADVGATDLLKACQNLLILDERLNVFRFAHLSVEEYMETQQLRVDSHTEIAKICLSLVFSLRSWADYGITRTTQEGRYHDRHLLLYAAVFWPWHLNHCKDDCRILAALWEAFVSDATFHHWIEYHRQRVQTEDSEDTFWSRSEAFQQDGGDLLSTVCLFGLGRKLSSISESQSGWTAIIKLNSHTTLISQSVQKGCIDRLLLCASNFGDLDIAQHLLGAGADVSTASPNGSTPLHKAICNGHEALARLLVNQYANVSAAVENWWTPLHAAAAHGPEALAQLLVERGADVSASEKNGRTPLHFAAGKGHEALACLLVDRGAKVSAADSDGWTPLHCATWQGHEALAQLLVYGGADVSASEKNGRTPLHVAATHGHEALAQLFVERGAEVSAATSYGNTPLHNAAREGHEALARLLVYRGADVSAADSDGTTPLHDAAWNGDEELAQLLVARGADVSATDCDGKTPLHFAARKGHGGLASLLVDRGANVSAADSDGRTPLHGATWNGYKELAQQLVARGADVSAADSEGIMPLHVAAAHGHEALAQLLVERGADISVADSDGSTPLHFAARKGHEALARLLVGRGANVSAAREDWRTPLHFAAGNGHEGLASLLVDRGANISAADSDGNTPLHFAARKGHEALARLLVERGANVSAACEDWRTPLHLTATHGHEALAQLLVERGADISVADSDGVTPLHEAVRERHEALARLLVYRDADVSAADSEGLTPLHGAAWNGDEELVQLLVARGADVSAADSDGETPLHNAARNGHEGLASLLVDRGANVSAVDSDGNTPLHFAAREGHEGLARLLASGAPSSQ